MFSDCVKIRRFRSLKATDFSLLERKRFGNPKIIFIFAPSLGRVAERLGRGLQNLVQRFKSASDLFKTTFQRSVVFFFKIVLKEWE